MRLIKIGLASVNTTVGAFRSNTDAVIARACELAEGGCAVVAFQEQIIAGYPAEDMVQWRAFVAGQRVQLRRFADATRDLATVFTLGLTVERDGHLYNSVAVVCGGRVLGFVPKEKLPTYGVFYEKRTFSHGRPGFRAEADGIPFGDLIFHFPFGTLSVETCEDIWTPDGPMRRRCFSGAEVVVNASASPFRSGVAGTRRELISTRAADNEATVVYVNQVGGNDALVFDGGGFVNQNGRMMLEAPRWREGAWAQTVDLDRTARLRHENTTWRSDAEAYLSRTEAVPVIDCPDGPSANPDGVAYPAPVGPGFFIPGDATRPSARDDYFADLVEAKIMGLDYYAKTFGSGPLGIALSGGKDSIITLVIAWLYARRRFASLPDGERDEKTRGFIRCFSMPTRFNSETTKGISRRLCEELGVTFAELPIEEAFVREVAAAEAMLAPGETLTLIARQNIQARLRAGRMWNWANSVGGFWIQTGNMSEKAVGYTTVGGDLSGAYSLIGNEPKSVIIEELGWLVDRYGLKAVREVLETKASAELADDQEDERDLMPFPVLDACMALYAGEKLDRTELVAALRSSFPEHDAEQLRAWAEKFVRLFRRSIFKWTQAPESVHLGTLELDRERAMQLPIVQGDEWQEG